MQKYVLVRAGKTINDVYKVPENALQYSGGNDEIVEDCEWIINDTARIDALYAADHPAPIEQPIEAIPAEK